MLITLDSGIDAHRRIYRLHAGEREPVSVCSFSYGLRNIDQEYCDGFKGPQFGTCRVSCGISLGPA